MRPIFVVLLFASLLSTAEPFSPAIAVQPKTKLATQSRLEYRTRDEIATELVELIPREHRPAHHSKDYSPWKRIMELEGAEDKVRELQKKLDKAKKEEKTIESLERVAYALFLEVVLLYEERSSARKLCRRLFRVTSQRVNESVGKTVDRALKALHMFHEYEVERELE